MQDSIWDPERLANVGWIMSRYSPHLQEGDRIQRGIEGDPCGVYRGSEGANGGGTVTRVTRGEDGLVTFTARMDATNDNVEFDNRSVSVDKVWEIHPEYVETFRGRIARDAPWGDEVAATEDVDDAAADANEADETAADDGNVDKVAADEKAADEKAADDVAVQETNVEEFRSSMVSLDTRLKEMEYAGTEIERTMASAFRELCGDVMRTFRGEEPLFSPRYVDRYDLALAQTSDGTNGVHADEYRGDGRAPARSKQYEKFAYSDNVTEASSLSD